MKKLSFFLILILLFLATSCATYYLPLPQVRIHSNIPWHTTTITIVNGTNLLLDVIHDGRLIKENLMAGEYLAVGIWNTTTASAQSTIVIVAKSNDGRLVGTASRTYYVSGYYRQSEAWTVNKWDIH